MMETNGYQHLSPTEFVEECQKRVLTGGSFVYFTGFLLRALPKREKDPTSLGLLADLAMKGQEKRDLCLTQRCLRRCEGLGDHDPVYEYRATVVRPQFRLGQHKSGEKRRKDSHGHHS